MGVIFQGALLLPEFKIETLKSKTMKSEEEKQLITEAQLAYKDIMSMEKNPAIKRETTEEYKIAILGALWKKFEHFPYVSDKFAFFKLKIDSDLDRLTKPKPAGKWHRLKTVQPYFEEIWVGDKGAECRFNDRDYQVGDQLRLCEYHPEDLFSGREMVATVKHVLKDFIGLSPGYAMLSIEVTEWIGPN